MKEKKLKSKNCLSFQGSPNCATPYEDVNWPPAIKVIGIEVIKKFDGTFLEIRYVPVN